MEFLISKAKVNSSFPAGQFLKERNIKTFPKSTWIIWDM